jgi:hypothetical protein
VNGAAHPESTAALSDIAPTADADHAVRFHTRVLVPVFAAALFLSATLLFSVQPMFGKMALPRLGGAPAVWNGCVLFFQCALLGGYAYAHALTRHLTLRHQVWLHTLLLGSAILTLPITIPEAWAPSPDRAPLAWLLGVMTMQLGLPLLLLCASAPLLQHWFSRTRDAAAQDPYFLYSASNFGSLLALLLYPFFIEPLWSVSDQAAVWSFGYGLLMALVFIAGTWARHGGRGAQHAGESHDASIVGAALRWHDRVWWLGLALVPSSLLLGVTTYISTDVAPAPLLWILPLAAYLLSFVLAFRRDPGPVQEMAFRAVPLLLLPAMITFVTGTSWPVALAVPVHVTLFFLVALSLHAELARRRPPARHLTEFYLWLAVGGACGGLFNALVAPLLFTGVIEYPLMLALACFLRRSTRGQPSGLTAKDILMPLSIGLAAAGVVVTMPPVTDGPGPLHFVMLGTLLIWAFSCSRRPVRFALVVLLFLAASALRVDSGTRLFQHRSYFGVIRVEHDPGTNRHVLYHGNTLHGEQGRGSAAATEPLAYYHRDGPVGQLLRTLDERLTGRHIGVVGLGTGAMAAYAQPGQRWTFFELDPMMDRIARDRRLFSYLDACGSRCRTVLGDARVSLARTDETFGLLVLDAFSSDAIPVHLLTREALHLYLDRLDEDGVLALHVSNRHFDLKSLLRGLADEHGLLILARDDRVASGSARQSSDWVVMARSASYLGSLIGDKRWTSPAPLEGAVWTDAHSNLLRAIKF